MARPRIELEDITFDGWKHLESLAVWASEEYCAAELKISIDTLARRIKEKHNCSFAEFRLKRQEPMRINIMKKQYDVAMQGNVTMLIWMGKQYLGQKDRNEVSNPEGKSFKLSYSTKDKDE